MQALYVDALSDDFSGCRLRDGDDPAFDAAGADKDRVCVRIRAAALGFPDLLMTQGGYQYKPPLPFIAGTEIAGEIVALGSNVRDFAIGDDVCAASQSGGFAEYGIYDVSGIRAKPSTLSYAQAAGVQSAYLTAYVALVRRAHLRPSEWVLVHGAAGGVGLAAVDLAQHLGGRVIAASSSDTKLAQIKKHYAPEICLNIEGGFREKVKDITDGGADIIYDPIGGDVFDESVRCIRWGGRLLVIGFTSGRIATIGANMPLIKGFSVVGVRAGEYGRRDPARGRENLDKIWHLAATGAITPHIHQTLPLSQWREAFRLMQSREVIGRVILEP